MKIPAWSGDPIPELTWVDVPTPGELKIGSGGLIATGQSRFISDAHTSVSWAPVGYSTSYTLAGTSEALAQAYQWYGEPVHEAVGRYLTWHSWHRDQIRESPNLDALNFAMNVEFREYNDALLSATDRHRKEIINLHWEIREHIKHRCAVLSVQSLYADSRPVAPSQRVILPNVQYAQGMARPYGWTPCGRHPGYRRLVIA